MSLASPLAKIALTLIDLVPVRSGRAFVARLWCLATIAVSIAILGLAAAVCLMAALWISMIPFAGAAGAPAIAAGVLLALCAGLYQILRHVRKPSVEAPAAIPDPRAKQLALLAALLTGFEAGRRHGRN